MQRPQPTQRVVIDLRHMHRARLAVRQLTLTRILEAYGAVRADALAGMAPDALLRRDIGLARRVLLHLARAAAATHAEVLHAAAEACLLVPP